MGSRSLRRRHKTIRSVSGRSGQRLASTTRTFAAGNDVDAAFQIVACRVYLNINRKIAHSASDIRSYLRTVFICTLYGYMLSYTYIFIRFPVLHFQCTHTECG